MRELLLHVVDQAVHGVPLSEKLASGDETTPRFFSELVSAYAAPSLRRLRRLAIEIHAAASRDKDAAELLSDFNQRTHQALRQRLERCIESGALPAELDPRRTASLLLVLVMGLAHLDTLEPTLLGDRAWTRFLERSVERLLRESGSHRGTLLVVLESLSPGCRQLGLAGRSTSISALSARRA